MERSFLSVFNRVLLLVSLQVLMTCFMHEGFTYGVEGKIASHTVSVGSLLSSPSCSPSTTKASNRKATLEVVHKQGPCSSLVQGHKPLNLAQTLLRDESRVKWIQSHSRNSMKASAAASVRAKSDIAGDYVVTVGLGTPRKNLTLLMDTGSPLTWTQCTPCAESCYTQPGPIFNPSQSSSYANVSCNSTLCSLGSIVDSGCYGSTCNYSIEYGDNSSSVGFLATEKLTISPTVVIDNFEFGCGEDNLGTFGTAAGLFGLSDSNISFVEQTKAMYGKHFSYCLPSSASSTGHLTFGNNSGVPSSVSFTPLSKVQQDSEFYGISIVGISVGGNPLSIPSKIFSTAGAVIDSGTTITQLPPTVYRALRNTFRKGMVNYTKIPAISNLDTCYDFSKVSTIVVPSIAFSFAGGVEVNLDFSGILFVESASQACLAFTANGADTDLVVYGNVQQRTFEVVYDVAGRKLGFGPNGCS